MMRLAHGDVDTFDRRERQILKARNRPDEQYKHQYLLTDVVTQPG